MCCIIPESAPRYSDRDNDLSVRLACSLLWTVERDEMLLQELLCSVFEIVLKTWSGMRDEDALRSCPFVLIAATEHDR